jgi:hypothetical protein
VASYSDKTIKMLALLAGNECAIPGCPTPLLTKSGALLGEICHICADKPGGPRYDPNQSNAERQHYSNLILLCPTHHTLVDSDETTYTADLLREIKNHHESKAHKRFSIDDSLATRIATVFLGGAAAVDARELAKELYDNISISPSPSDDPDHRSLFDESLRYAPKGVFAYFSEDDLHLRFGEFLSSIFRAAGWRIQRLTRHPEVLPDNCLIEFSNSIFCLFTMPDQHQLSNAHRAIADLFFKLGFVPSTTGDKYDRTDEMEGRRITIYPSLTVRR